MTENFGSAMTTVSNDKSDYLSELELVAKCSSCDNSEAWELFVRKYSGLIWSSIHKAFRSSSFRYNPEDVEDVFSSLFLSLLDNNCKKLHQFHSRNSCALSTWLAVVSVRHTIDYMRRQRRHQMASSGDRSDVFESLPDRRPNIENVLMERQRQAAVHKNLAKLPSQDRALLDLLSSKNLKPEAIAKELGITTSSFYTRKHRLIEKLKKL